MGGVEVKLIAEFVTMMGLVADVVDVMTILEMEAKMHLDVERGEGGGGCGGRYGQSAFGVVSNGGHPVPFMQKQMEKRVKKKGKTNGKTVSEKKRKK